jgi:hypothetical protein
MTAICNHILVTKERMASPLDFIPELQEFWTAHPARDRVFGPITDVFKHPHSSLDSPSAIRPMYDDKHMLKVVQHATPSALNKNQEAIATFLLLPNWMENSTNAFHKICTDNKDGTFLGNIPKINCATCHSYTSKAKHHPC